MTPPTSENSPRTIITRILAEGPMNPYQFAKSGRKGPVMFRGVYGRFARMIALGLLERDGKGYGARYRITELGMQWARTGFPMWRRMPNLEGL